MTWVVAGVSLLATWLNIRGNALCFWCWSCTNCVWASTCFVHGLPAQGCLHLVYAGLAVWGIVRWRTRPPRAAHPPGA